MKKGELILEIIKATDAIEYIEKEIHNTSLDESLPIATKSLLYQRLQLGLNCSVMKYQLYKDWYELTKEDK